MAQTVRILPRKLAAAVSAVFMAGGALVAAPANAIGLLDACQAALRNDANYRAAFFENEASKENRLMARANLLPSVQASYSASRNNVDTDTTFNGQTSTTHPKYISRSAMLQARQPLVNYEAAARYREAVAQTKAGESQFDSRTQEVILRAVGAYLDLLYADDQVRLAKAQRDTLAEQARANKSMFDKGESARTDVIETQARLDVIEAQLIEAMDTQNTARVTLAGIIGQPVDQVDGLSADFKVRPQDGISVEDWKAKAIANNPELKSIEQQVAVAREEVNRSKAGHMPRVDLVANYGKTAAETIATSNQESVVRSVGVQLSVPIYSGGYNNAATRQSVANLERAKATYDAAKDKLTVELRKEFALVQSSVKRVEAVQKAVESAKLLVVATEQSIKGGVRINLDLLNARQQLLTAQRDLTQARFGYLLAELRLRSAGGALTIGDVKEMAVQFR